MFVRSILTVEPHLPDLTAAQCAAMLGRWISMSRRVRHVHGALRNARSCLSRKLAAALLAGAILFAGGCVATGPLKWIHNGLKVGPNHGKPPAPLAHEWIEAQDPRVQGPPPRDGNWWQ